MPGKAAIRILMLLLMAALALPSSAEQPLPGPAHRLRDLALLREGGELR